MITEKLWYGINATGSITFISRDIAPPYSPHILYFISIRRTCPDNDAWKMKWKFEDIKIYQAHPLWHEDIVND